jgi:CO/xanthine dehydrogenase FAD-binding subunit
MTTAYHQPVQLEEALRLVARGATPIAGATALFSARSLPEGELVDVTRCGLGEIRVEEERLVIGATATLSRIGEASDLPGMEGALLRRAARAAGSRPMRNMITLGGNLAHSAFWADMPPALLALDAEVEVQRAGEPARLVSIEDCLRPGKRPWEGGLITAIAVPLAGGIGAWGYERFSRTANDYALATACVALRREKKVTRSVRVVLGALQNRPYRLSEAEQIFEGKAFGSLMLEQAAAAVRERAQVAPNFRASEAYRRDLTGTLVRRAVDTALSWALRES